MSERTYAVCPRCRRLYLDAPGRAVICVHDEWDERTGGYKGLVRHECEVVIGRVMRFASGHWAEEGDR